MELNVSNRSEGNTIDNVETSGIIEIEYRKGINEGYCVGVMKWKIIERIAEYKQDCKLLKRICFIKIK